jgi:transcriptional regulator with XRE-family HTH domain
MTKTLAPEVRTEFAKRLKEMRIHGGFVRARYFAKSLGIEENRYTRYERAEVEPSLTLIHKMCEILRVSPNALLGFAESSVGADTFPAFAEDSVGGDGRHGDAGERHRDLLAWRLASEAVAVRSKHRGRGKAADPLATKRETAKLFQKLQGDPFGTVAELVGDDVLKELGAERRAELAELIDAYTDSLAKAASRSRRSS